MGRSCPLQNAQPLGAKPNETILISARNGFDIGALLELISVSLAHAEAVLASRWKNSKQRDNVIYGQIREHVVMGLVPARIADIGCIHLCTRGRGIRF